MSESVQADWTTWIPYMLAECSRCSALVKDTPESKQNHLQWHKDKG